MFYFNLAYMNLNWDIDIFFFYFLNINVVYDIAYIKFIFNCIKEPTSYSSESLVFQRPRQKEPRNSTASRDSSKVMHNFEVLKVGYMLSVLCL